MSFQNITILGYIINFLLIMIVVCFQRRDPVVSMAWVLAFILFPIGGLVIFLIFGTGLKRGVKKKYLQKLNQETEFLKRFSKSTVFPHRIFEIPYSGIAQYLQHGAKSTFTGDNKVDIFTDASDMYTSLIHDIRNAKSTINMMYFIYRSDDIGTKIMDELVKKVKDGIEVRFLYDDFGCFLSDKRLFDRLKKAGGKVAPFFPVKFGIYSKLNHRNHRKITVIDGSIGYLGGMNIGDEYMGKKKPSPWRDTHIKVQGSSVTYIQKYFALDWEFSTDEQLDREFKKFFLPSTADIGHCGIQIVSGGPESPNDEVEFALLKALNTAKKYAYIQTPYFVPDKAFLTAIKITAQSGVDVRIMLPGIPDKQYVYYVTTSYIGELLESGVRVFVYDGFLHAKTMVIDDTVSTIGTTNIDIRSFQLHFETNAFIYDIDIAKQCRHIFENDMKKCREINIDEYNRRGLSQTMKEGFFRLFSPIM